MGAGAGFGGSLALPASIWTWQPVSAEAARAVERRLMAKALLRIML